VHARAVRHGDDAIAEILDPEGISGRWAWRALVAYSVGFLTMIPFFSLPGLFTDRSPRSSAAPTSRSRSASSSPRGVLPI
jgi:hypothetical protein